MIRAEIKVDGKDVVGLVKDGPETKVKVRSVAKILATPILTKVALDLKPIFYSEGNKISLGKTFFASIFGKK
ncbi:MAG: hypothetical protein U9O53_05870 [archaeon]|nr:hypothetical protein [archaeon]